MKEPNTNEQDVKEQAKEEKVVFTGGCGIDVGTANLVVTRRTESGAFVARHHRNMLFELDASDEALDLLSRGDFLYVKSGNKYFVIGEDALRLATALAGEVIRPMSQGILNPSIKKSQELLFQIISAVVGKPVCEKEALRFSVPANIFDAPDNNGTFHEMVLTSFFESMGYSPKPVNEALANLYCEAPYMEDKTGAKIPLSGMSISCGAGLVNACVAFKGMSVCEFSLSKSGDYIDKQVSNVTGESIPRVIGIKENKLDLSTPDRGDVVIQALEIYYDEFIRRIFVTMSKELTKRNVRMDYPIKIAVCGGTAMVPGFIDRVSLVMKSASLPFEAKEIVLVKNPFLSVSYGCCILAISDMARSSRNEKKA